ncbi:MAG: MFS transporter [Lentisphaeria bacterium]|nr:MFS transporter [Lentisphaeria bacterium]
MNYAESLTPRERRHYENVAIASTMFGGTSTQIVESSAPIVLYLTLLGGSRSAAMFSTSLPSLSNILLLIPCAAFAARWGLRKTYTLSSTAGFLSFLLIAGAPYFGDFARTAVICGTFAYAMTVTFYTSTWYPLLDNILTPQTRSTFFSRMRFTYMSFNTVFLFFLGKFLTQNSSLGVLQCVFVFAGLLLWGRKLCMDRLPIAPEMSRESPDLRKSLTTCLGNRPLVNFSLYLGCMYLIVPAGIPLALVAMKTCLSLENGTIVVISSIALAGRMAGYLLMGILSGRVSMRALVIGTHLAALLSVALLVFITPDTPKLAVVLGGIFFLHGMVWALLLCINSVEMLAHARPGNKIMAIAFCSTAIAVGTVAGTLITSALLGASALPENFTVSGISFGKFQLFFAAYTLALLLFLALLPIVPAVTRKQR